MILSLRQASHALPGLDRIGFDDDGDDDDGFETEKVLYIGMHSKTDLHWSHPDVEAEILGAGMNGGSAAPLLSAARKETSNSAQAERLLH